MRTRIVFVSVLAVIASLLLLAASPAQAARGTLKVSHTDAVVGQYITFSGYAGSKGVKEVMIERTLYGTRAAGGKTKADGTYRFKIRMTAMPTEGYRLRVKGKVKSETVYVNSIRQNVTISVADNTALINVYPVMSRGVELQQQTGPASWQTIGVTTTDSNGNAVLEAPVGPTYRAVAKQAGDIVEYYSTPAVTVYPALTETPSSLDGPTTTYSYTPDTATSAALKYSWWPYANVWDWEDTRGMNKWSNYVTGSGRAALSYGGLILNSGAPGSRQAHFGDVSSTLVKRGAAETGNWETRSKHSQQGPGYTPYTVRYSLVPQGTPDGTRPRTEIVLAQHTGYTDQTVLSVRDGENEYVKTVSNFAHNAQNWHTYAVNVTDKRVSWIINRKVVASWNRTDSFKGSFVPRMELVAVPNARMTQTALNTDWIRQFPLKPKAKKFKGDTSGFVVTPLS